MTRTVPAAADGEASASPSQDRLALRRSIARLFHRPKSIFILALAPLVAIGVGFWGWQHDWVLGVDSAVYRAGALTLLHGDPLYDANTLIPEPWWALLPFTYPPSAAAFFIPLAFFPTQVAWGLLTAVSLAALALVIRIAIGALPRPAEDGPRWWASPARSTLAFFLVFFALEPVWRTIFLGQINIILMALIMLDILVIGARGSRWGGVLVGIAAAIKLTPLVFIGHLFVTGRRMDAVRAFATFIVIQGAMFLINAHDAARYWTVTLPDTGRIGPVHWAGNQSLNALLNRASDLAPWASKAAMGIGIVLAIPALWLMLKFHKKGQALAALLVTAFWILLISPVSWSHHWVWVVPLIVLLVSRLPQTSPAKAWKRWLGTAAVFYVFVSCVLLLLPNGRNVELHWKVWQNILGSAYILMPLVLFAAITLRWGLQKRRASAAEAG
ncbi:alpha-1,2-mannosyltransferase [Amycolatopsis xylanica]|uniref:Alpha-1,2-mannosyltransferase n=1 Tax=Amycolatopsis xylanica TaxID=589385 RepID=A0A1H3M7L4_9PSEU|nr:glycosyltransferase 87 family protein [Amycolatopsis xylanica]SDY72238.1 alpha-1,2-mannosyltransferase [Amycolatopsis xylanica]